MIIGMDLMCEIGIYLNTETKEITWEDTTIPMKQKGELHNKEMAQWVYDVIKEPVGIREAVQRQSRILDADYSAVDIAEHINSLQHLTSTEKNKLIKTLQSYPAVFQGGLGTLKIKPIHLELIEGAKPYHGRSFPIPQSLENITKKEMDRLTNIGVFRRSYDSEWAAPTFVQPKKTGDVRILTDFRKLNMVLKRKPFPLPKIADLLQKLTGFKYATAIDLSMGYYHIPLDEASQRLCTTILPWGKYQYLRLPMGIKNSPDIFQAIMSDLLGDLDFARAYIDDILIVSNGTFEDHMHKLKQVLQRLQNVGFRANVRKCFFAKDELEYLGFWLTRKGIQPQPKKVEAIQRLLPPKNKKQLRHFLGMVNFYRDMWRRRSHLLAPLTELVSNKKNFVWGTEQQKAFDEMKRIISKETLLSFPDFAKEFHVYTDASNTQLGAVIMQEGKPLAFYSRKMNKAQQNYTTGEQELLSIVETLKEFRNILLGQKLIIHTDHMNILYGKLSNDRITRWRLLLEEYGPEYVHIKGIDNVVADALSRMNADSSDVNNQMNEEHYACMFTYAMVEWPQEGDYESPDARDVTEMAVSYASEQDKINEKFPMSPLLIAKEQKKDNKLMKSLEQGTKVYRTKKLEGKELITYNDKIVVPEILRDRIISWYHHYLCHPGQLRMEATLRQNYYWEKMRATVQSHVKACKICQMCKKPRKQYGHLPVKTAEEAEPWKRVNVDMIGPLSVKTPSKKKFELVALTMIDPATGWFEVAAMKDRTSETAMKIMDDVWFARYPRPEMIGFDNGSEYKNVFKEMIQNYGLKAKPTTAWNPQSNGIIERVHQVLNDGLRTFELEQRELDDEDPWTPFLSSVAFAIRSTYHTTLGATPAQLVFNRDMILPIQMKFDWERIREQRQRIMHKSNERENATRIPHEYKVGDKILLTKPGMLRKLSVPRTGPHLVQAVYTNGTLRIQRGSISERVNIRRVTPFTEASP
jgi:hypothetical protein